MKKPIGRRITGFMAAAALAVTSVGTSFTDLLTAKAADTIALSSPVFSFDNRDGTNRTEDGANTLKAQINFKDSSGNAVTPTSDGSKYYLLVHALGANSNYGGYQYSEGESHDHYKLIEITGETTSLGNITAIRALMEILRGTETVTLRALDSRESYEKNKIYYQQRLEEERNPAIRELLLRDKAYLDEIQTMTASAREFALVYPLVRQGNESAEAQITRMEKDIRDRGFHVRVARDQDLKRLLAVYYQQDVTTEYFESIDGESVVSDDA